MTTIHANTSRDSLARLEQMVGMAGFQMSQSSIRSQIASAIRLVIQLQRQTDGTRRVMAVSEITGMEGEVVQMQDIFRYVRRGVDEDGKIVGEFRATGIRPNFLEDIQTMGFTLPQELFNPNHTL
jgi:pilus assembly protein CpaF